jgi:hypothetical protein
VSKVGAGCDRACRRSRTATWMRLTGDAVGMVTLEENQRACRQSVRHEFLRSRRGSSDSGSELGHCTSCQQCVVPRFPLTMGFLWTIDSRCWEELKGCFSVVAKGTIKLGVG